MNGKRGRGSFMDFYSQPKLISLPATHFTIPLLGTESFQQPTFCPPTQAFRSGQVRAVLTLNCIISWRTALHHIRPNVRVLGGGGSQMSFVHTCIWFAGSQAGRHAVLRCVLPCVMSVAKCISILASMGSADEQQTLVPLWMAARYHHS